MDPDSGGPVVQSASNAELILYRHILGHIWFHDRANSDLLEMNWICVFMTTEHPGYIGMKRIATTIPEWSVRSLGFARFIGN